jgi:hypothetical protein
MDYEFLRREGIRILERLGGRLWTDFNAHDPGITILEQVCYALTDLAYRINYDMKDLLASGTDDPYRSLLTPAQVLTTKPVTLTDLRKLVIDVPGVKNAWFEPVELPEPGLLYDPSEGILHLKTSVLPPSHYESLPLKGLYRVLIETDDNLALHAADILPEVNRRLQSCRNLGEDFLSPVILPGQPIVVDAEIEVGTIDDPDRLLAEIYYRLAEFISPHVRFHTLSEMLERGRRIDEIMDGPALQHGFIDDTELEGQGRKTGLRTSDLIQEILNVEGTLTVGSINIAFGSESHDWYLKLDPLSTPFLDIDTSLYGRKTTAIRLVRSGIPVQINPARVQEILARLKQADSDEPLPVSRRDVLLPAGRDRKVGQYYSIQHQFPAAYGIGSMGLPESATPQRKAQASQLKAYLMFFDQLLANYFAQLANANELFSFHAQEARTYFSQAIADASLGLEEVLGGDPAAGADRVREITETSALGVETIDPNDLSTSERKNRFLNHLLARFAEQFTDYSLLVYARISEQDLIEDKSAFLRDYHAIGASRGTGFNYAQPAWGEENVSGLEKRVSRKLGISNYHKHDLAALPPTDEGGFHMVEHLLLRPSPADRDQWTQTSIGANWQAAAYLAQPDDRDPYSHQISFIFPKWIQRFADQGFTDLIERTVREETPAHIRVSLHWIEKKEDMQAFEAAYKDWLEGVIEGRLWDPADIRPDDIPGRLTNIRLRDARDRMVQILELGVPYPLRDLILDYPAIVAYNHPAEIRILGGQGGVLYQLCDEDGNPVVYNGTSFEVRPDAGSPADKVVLPTPPIRRDITFTILAVREDQGSDEHAETYLNQTVSIKAGIDTNLPVTFEPAEGQLVAGNSITVDYGGNVTITLSNTQEGISYKLVSGAKDASVDRSKAVKGNQAGITLVTTDGFAEDTPINILAYRTSNSKISALLDTTLTVLVRPNPAVEINLENPIVDYASGSNVWLMNPQASVEYSLYKRDLVAADYLPDRTPGSLTVQTDEGRQISIRVPDVIVNQVNPPGFTLVDTFKHTGGSMPADTGDLLEDTLFLISATKVDNRERLQLARAVVVLVRPNPAPVVGVLAAVVDAGAEGTVTVQNTQKGVYYQLRLDADNRPINPPGYHLTDRGIDTVRLEVDMIVEDQGKPILLLPAGPIATATTFNVLAGKILTGVSQQLTGKATIDVTPAAAGEDAGVA